MTRAEDEVQEADVAAVDWGEGAREAVGLGVTDADPSDVHAASATSRAVVNAMTAASRLAVVAAEKIIMTVRYPQ
jgi:hypothetical protein